jgi:hypothetical protein
MRQLGFLSILLLIIFYHVTGFAYSYGEKPEYQLLVSGVAGITNNKDMNDSAESDAQKTGNFVNSLYPSPPGPYSYNVETTKGNLPVGIDIDFRFFFEKKFGIGLQAGYHFTKAESKVTGSFPNKDLVTLAYELSVIPVVATMLYRMDLESEKNFVLFGGGVGFYLGIISFDFKWKNNNGNIDPSGHGLFINSVNREDFRQLKTGFHFLLEYDYVFDSGFTLFAGIKVRFVKFDEFKRYGFTLLNNSGEKFEASLTGVALYFGAGYSF